MNIRRFDLEKLISARKMKTHCVDWTIDEILDEVVALYNKYYLPEIMRLDDIPSKEGEE